MKLNNKGYLIVEVILAGALTFAMAYFLINLTLKIRNRSDDVNVETVMLNDKTVVTNEIMSDVVGNKVKNIVKIDNGITINFEDGTSKDLTIVNNTITYGTYTKKFNENAIVGDVNIKRNGNYFLIEIPVSTKYSDKDYGINILAFTEEEFETLWCNLSANDTEITAETSNGLLYYGWDSSYSGENSESMPISVGEHTYYIKDTMSNISNCSISIVKTTESEDLDCGNYTVSGSRCSHTVKSTLVASGSCYCTNDAKDEIEQVACSGANKTSCKCTSKYPKEYSNRCNPYYTCNGNKTSSSTCTVYTDGEYVTKYNCPEGYTKINNTYCSKVIGGNNNEGE